jgi:hypothetical protein
MSDRVSQMLGVQALEIRKVENDSKKYILIIKEYLLLYTRNA